MSSPYLHALITGPPGIGKTTVIKRVCSMVQKHRGDVHVSGFYTEEVREGGRGGRGARVGFDVVTLEGERGVLARLSGHPVCGAGGGRLKKAPCVGRYTVDVESFEKRALPTLQNDPESKISPAPSSITAETSGEVDRDDANVDACDVAVSAESSVCSGEKSAQKSKLSSSGQKLRLGSQASSVIRRHVIVIDEIGKMELLSHGFVNAVRNIFEQKPKDTSDLVLATIPIAGHKTHWQVEELRHRKDCMLFEVTEKNRDSLPEEISQFILKIL